MLVNPLFDPDEDQKTDEPQPPALRRRGKTIQPLDSSLIAPSHAPPSTHGTKYHTVSSEDSATTQQTPDEKNDAAVELIRRKVQAIYSDEPDAKTEIKKTAAAPLPLSTHQQFMQSLSTSGKSLAQIQTEWHQYYVALPDDQKHAVWQEFYRANARQSPLSKAGYDAAPHPAQADHPHTDKSVGGHSAPKLPQPKAIVADHLPDPKFEAKKQRRQQGQLHKRIIDSVGISAAAQTKAKQHLQSLLFGVGTGVVVLCIFLFSFFNEVIIAPFIQPSRHVSATPIILNSDSVAPSATPEVIIPKINVQIPTVFDAKSSKESDIQAGLEEGVIHYPTTVLPGQKGNAAFFGHSSNNIFNKGKYKFAFVLLHQLVPGDIFYLTYDKKVYTYRVYDKKIVAPSEVSVLNTVSDKVATATLITCDPPGTANNRLVVWGEQISPDPVSAADVAPADPAATPSADQLPSNGPSLWSRFTEWLF